MEELRGRSLPLAVLTGFRRTEMCIIPYGTQEGEISFCAYNTGIGWRNIIEHMHQNATVAQWYKDHGRHEVFARGKEVDLEDQSHNLNLNAVDLTRPTNPKWKAPRPPLKKCR